MTKKQLDKIYRACDLIYHSESIMPHGVDPAIALGVVDLDLALKFKRFYGKSQKTSIFEWSPFTDEIIDEKIMAILWFAECEIDNSFTDTIFKLRAE